MKASLFTVLLLALLPLNAYAQEQKPAIADGVVTHQDLFNSAADDSVACYRIPALVTAPNGDLIAAIDERVPSCADLRGNKNINVVLRRSSDGGMTWFEIETVVDLPQGESASDPSMIVDEGTGEIFLFYNYMNLEKAPDVYRLYVVKSSDNGKTWSEPEDITSQITKPGWRDDFKFITSGRGIQTGSGTLLHTLVNLDAGLHLFGSDDHGESWFLIDTPIEPANESKVVELADSTWMINSRVNSEEGMRYVHTSTDQGETWDTRRAPELIDPSSNASIIRCTSTDERYEKNRLLFANAKSAERRENLTVRVSYDEGETWTDGKTIYPGPSAYSSLTVLENGDIGVFFEKDDYTENVFVRFSLAWLTDGEDELAKTP
jgi:sialidase-1